jgi:putative Ca2+/H+ antiporter (TMEM165/GDT1 family)
VLDDPRDIVSSRCGLRNGGQNSAPGFCARHSVQKAGRDHGRHSGRDPVEPRARVLGRRLDFLPGFGRSHESFFWARSFIGFGIWILVPDADDDREHPARFGAFLTTTVVFFLAEMGDKTQLATVALGARFNSFLLVTVGTTLGMLFSDGLAVFLGEKFSDRISMKHLRWAASALFILFGVVILVR